MFHSTAALQVYFLKSFGDIATVVFLRA